MNHVQLLRVFVVMLCLAFGAVGTTSADWNLDFDGDPLVAVIRLGAGAGAMRLEEFSVFHDVRTWRAEIRGRPIAGPFPFAA